MFPAAAQKFSTLHAVYTDQLTQLRDSTDRTSIPQLNMQVGKGRGGDKRKRAYEQSPSRDPYEVVRSNLASRRDSLPESVLFLHKLYRHSPPEVFCHLYHLPHVLLGNRGRNDQAVCRS